jgi:hypothetical protein
MLCTENSSTATSAWSKVEQGVQQSLVLGPLLFLVFINHLPKFINDEIVPILFADDTSILVSQPNPLVFLENLLIVYFEL